MRHTDTSLTRERTRRVGEGHTHEAGDERSFFEQYHEPTDERGLTLREQLALEMIEADGKIPPELRVPMARWWRHLPQALYADSIDLTRVLGVGRTGVVHSIRQARDLLRTRLGDDFMSPVILRRSEDGFPRTRLFSLPDAILWQQIRPKQPGRWPGRRRRRKGDT